MKNLKLLLTALLTFSITTSSMTPIYAETAESDDQGQEELKQPALVSEHRCMWGCRKNWK